MKTQNLRRICYSFFSIFLLSTNIYAKKRPNVVLILLDDVGYSDLGCYGSEISTPNIDALAENGIRMSCFYNQARSAPTRGSLITGLYPHQEGQGSLKKVPGYSAYQGYANENNIFISEVLKDGGYFSVMTGKWHIGFDQGVTPIKRGFDRSLNAPVGGYYFYDDIEKRKVRYTNKRLYKNDKLISFNDASLPKEWYSTFLWTKCGLDYIDEAIDNNKPFFWYLAYNGAHFPIQAPQKTIKKYLGKYLDGWNDVRKKRFEKQKGLGFFSQDVKITPRNPKIKDWNSLSKLEQERQDTIMAVYAAAIEEIDNGVGMVINHLKEKGVFDDTIIILLSDNGGNAEGGLYGRCYGDNPGSTGSTVWLGAAWADVSNTPFFLYKHHAHEGGCNTPFIISYPNGMNKNLYGSINKCDYGHIIDIMATIVDYTGVHYPNMRNGFVVQPMEGISLRPILEGGKLERSKPIIVEHEGNKMLRWGKWKIVQEYTETEWMLFDMDKDPTEMVDLANDKPEILNTMVNKYYLEAKRTNVEPNLHFKVGDWYVPTYNYEQ